MICSRSCGTNSSGCTTCIYSAFCNNSDILFYLDWSRRCTPPAGAAGGSDEVSLGDVSGEEMVLGAGAGDVGVGHTRATGGGDEGGPGDVGSEEMVLRAGAGAE